MSSTTVKALEMALINRKHKINSFTIPIEVYNIAVKSIPIC